MNNEELKRKSLIKIISKVLEANIELMTYYKHIATDDESRRSCSKSIKQSKKAIEKLPHIQHIEILVSLYNAIICGKEFVFITGGSLICSKKFDRWDKTKNGFKEFMALEEEAQQAYKNRVEEEEKTRKVVEEAKAQGKKVSFAYIDGKMKPIIEEEPKA